MLVSIDGGTIRMEPPAAEVVAWLVAVGMTFTINADGRVVGTWGGCDPLADALIGITVNGCEAVYRVADLLALLKTARAGELAAVVAKGATAAATTQPETVVTRCYRCGTPYLDGAACPTCHPLTAAAPGQVIDLHWPRPGHAVRAAPLDGVAMDEGVLA